MVIRRIEIQIWGIIKNHKYDIFFDKKNKLSDYSLYHRIPNYRDIKDGGNLSFEKSGIDISRRYRYAPKIFIREIEPTGVKPNVLFNDIYLGNPVLISLNEKTYDERLKNIESGYGIGLIDIINLGSIRGFITVQIGIRERLDYRRFLFLGERDTHLEYDSPSILLTGVVYINSELEFQLIELIKANTAEIHESFEDMINIASKFQNCIDFFIKNMTSVNSFIVDGKKSESRMLIKRHDQKGRINIINMSQINDDYFCS